MQLPILPLCIFDDLASVLEGVLERVTFANPETGGHDRQD